MAYSLYGDGRKYMFTPKGDKVLITIYKKSEGWMGKTVYVNYFKEYEEDIMKARETYKSLKRLGYNDEG